MQLKRAYHIATDRDSVWHALNDASVLQQLIPGCSEIKWTSDTSLEARIEINLGVVQPKFTGVLDLSDIDPAKSYTLTGHGKGGLFGKVEGHAHVTLSDVEGGTQLAFTAGGAASGQLARFGSVLLGAGANRLVDGFFTRFGAAMKAEVTPLDTQG